VDGQRLTASFGRDQPEVARRVTECGAGVSLPAKRLTAERLREAVREAIAMRPAALAASARLRATAGAGRFADAAEELAAERLPHASSSATASSRVSAMSMMPGSPLHSKTSMT
jgi:hypothetical protein